MIDKPATHQAEHTTLNTVDAIDSFDRETHKARQKASGSARFALFLSALALFFTTIGIAAGYKHWQRMDSKAKENAAEIVKLREQLQQVPNNDAVENLRKEVTDKTAQAQTTHEQAIQEMARLQNQTRQFAETVASQVEQVTFLQARAQQSAQPASTKDWQVAEVEFLLQLANRELHLNHSPKTAIAALKEADALLTKLGSVNYLPVRQQIAKDISTLEAVAIPDIAGLSQRISATLLSLKPLPAVETSAGADKAEPANKPQDNIEGNSLWAEYKRQALETLNHAVVVRQFDQPLQTALDADARQTLFQLLKLRLESLRLLALQRDHTGFQAQIELLKETVSTYYPEKQAEPLLATLAEFAKENLQLQLPDISASLKQMESARQAETAAAQPPPPPATETEAAPKKGGKRE